MVGLEGGMGWDWTARPQHDTMPHVNDYDSRAYSMTPIMTLIEQAKRLRLYARAVVASNPLLILIVLALWTVAAGPPQLRSGNDQPLRLSPAQIRSLTEIDRGPPIQARAAILVDRASNAVLWTKNPDDPLPMASTTKMMTALVALETLSPDQRVTVPSEAVVGQASMGLDPGEAVSVETLLYGALLVSGNDAAMTLAIRAAGNVDAFVERMNARAAEWGLNNTHFANPHGLDAPDHVSSALDLAALGRRVLSNPLLASIVATRSIVIGGYSLTNTNKLLTSYPGADGVKTGTTDAAGQVLVASATRGKNSAISVVMNSPDRFAESTRLLDFYFDNWQWIDVRLERSALNRAVAADGTVYWLSAPSRPLFLARWQIPQLRGYRRIEFDEAGQPSGVYQVWLADQVLLETPITFTAISGQQ